MRTPPFANLGESTVNAPRREHRIVRFSAALRRLATLALATGLVALSPGCGGGDNETATLASSTWVGTWATAPTGPADLAATAPFLPQITMENATLRMIVRSSIAGGKVRVRFSNEIGDAPAAVTIGSAYVALRSQGSSVVSGSNRMLTFGGQSTVTIPPRGRVVSDPVDLDVPALADLAVSIYLPQRTVLQSAHYVTRQTQYIVPASNAASAPSLPASTPTAATWFLLSGVDVTPRTANAAALVVLGDSITDGFGESITRVDAPTPWPAWPSRLAERLQATPSLVGLAVLNAGISGNRVLNDAAQSVPPSAAGLSNLAIFGSSAVSRFERDVSSQSGVSCAMIFEGINDIGQGVSRGQVVSAEQIIAGHQQLIARARAAGLRVLGATLTPFEGYASATYYSTENESKRQAVNAWIRSSASQYDAVIDFDALLRDPANPTRLLPQYDSGDHLHPSDVGYRAMAEGVDVAALQRLCLRAP